MLSDNLWQTNPTTAAIRASLALPLNPCVATSGSVDHESPKPSSSCPPIQPPIHASPLEQKIRAAFKPGVSQPSMSFLDAFPSVFVVAGYGDADASTLLRLAHSIATDPQYTLSHRLGHIARRALHKDRLERLQAAFTELSKQRGDEGRCEDSLKIVNGMVSEQEIWGVVAELRDILLDIVTVKCSSELVDLLTDVFNPNLITQMVTNGAYSSTQFISAMDSIVFILEQAAPLSVLRFDYWYRPVRTQLEQCKLGNDQDDFAFLCMELLETMHDVKLELANWRLSVLRQDICAAAVEWETNLTANMMSQDRAPLSRAIQAIQCSATSLKQSGTRLNCLTLHAELMVQLITLDCGHVPIPEPFELDRHKITQFQERVSMITLITALWTVAKVALDAAGIEERDSLLVQIRCSMLDTSVSSDDYTSWAHEFMHWMHSLATDQSKPLLVQHTAGTQLSNQLVAAAAPAGSLRRLMRARVIKILKSSPVFGGTGLKQAEQSQLEQCFMVVSGELCQVVEEITSVTAHLHSLYSPMYAPFAAQHPAPQAVWPEAATEITSKLVAVGDADDEEDDETFDYEQPSVVLQLPGLQPLRYSRSSDRRARSCGSPVSLKRQSSCGEAANAPPVQHVRQRTLGDCQSRSRTTDRGGAV